MVPGDLLGVPIAGEQIHMVRVGRRIDDPERDRGRADGDTRERKAGQIPPEKGRLLFAVTYVAKVIHVLHQGDVGVRSLLGDLGVALAVVARGIVVNEPRGLLLDAALRGGAAEAMTARAETARTAQHL